MTTTHQQQQPMTVGELSRRTGVPIKALRNYADWGLIYSIARSPTGYRLFHAEALWCVQLITELRGAGLTLAEIRDLTARYLAGTGEPIGPVLAELLQRSRDRLLAHIGELQQSLRGIEDFEASHQDQLKAERAACWAGDPRACENRP